MLGITEFNMLGIVFAAIIIVFWYKLDRIDRNLTTLISDISTMEIDRKMENIQKEMKKMVTELQKDGWSMK
jgi:hypothetical protein